MHEGATPSGFDDLGGSSHGGDGRTGKQALGSIRAWTCFTPKNILLERFVRKGLSDK